MRLALITDVHGNREALKTVLEHAQAQSYARCAFLGAGSFWPEAAGTSVGGGELAVGITTLGIAAGCTGSDAQAVVIIATSRRGKGRRT